MSQKQQPANSQGSASQQPQELTKRYSDPDLTRSHRPDIPKIDPNKVVRPTGSGIKPPPEKKG